jgi:hypothetical protein
MLTAGDFAVSHIPNRELALLNLINHQNQLLQLLVTSG